MGNMQLQDEALVAVQDAMNEKMSSLANFTNAATSTHDVDINRDGTKDYTVSVSKPVCVSKRPMPGYSVTVSASSPNMTYWEYDATVTDSSSGASVSARQGVKIILLPSQGCS